MLRLIRIQNNTGYTSLLLSICFLFYGMQGYAQAGYFTPLTHAAPHFNEGVMLLLTDGTVLCKTSSGGSGLGNRWDRLTPDSHGSYINGTWSTTVDTMHDERLYFSSQVLPDGRVYIAGGEYGSGGVKSEVWNPGTNVWTPCPQIVTANNISDANSELLDDGTVLQAIVDTGGTRLCSIYNPAANTYAWGPSTVRWNNEAMWVKLPDSSIVFNDGSEATTSERYHQTTHTWVADANLPVTLYDPYGDEAGAGFLLPNGQVYFIGSLPNSAIYTPSGGTANGVWTAGPGLPNGWGAPDAASAMMTNGHIIMCLSPAPTSGNHFPDSSAFFDFDYTTNTYIAVTAPGLSGDTVNGVPAYFSNFLCLPDGSVLFCNQYDNQYYEYTPGSAPLSAGKPTISNIIERGCDSFSITGTNFNGITEGAGYGDDWQMNTNYPIVRLTSGANVYYATTSYWNRIGAVATGGASDTAQFALPVGLPAGAYNVQVIANGNPSANYPFSTVPAVITPLSSTVCAGAASALSGSVGSGTWSSSGTVVAVVGSSSGIVSGVSAGAVTITYSLGACNTFATVTVNPSPATIIPAGVNLCSGGALTISDATGGGAWSSSNTTVVTVDLFGGTVGVSAGIATITYTASGCFVTTYATVNPLPGSITGAMSLCAGFTTALSDAGGGTWSSSNTAVAFAGLTTGIITGIMNGTSTINYVLSTGCAASATLTVNTSPGSINGNAEVCAGSTTSLSDGGTGTWSSSNTSVATVGLASGIVSGIVQGSSTITYSLGAGCSSTVVVTVDPLPGSISGTSHVCTGSTIALTDAGGGTWSSSNTGVATVDISSGIVTGVSASAASIIYTLPTGCDVNTVVIVNPVPSSITGVSTVCAGQTTALSDGSSGGGWSSGSTGIATVDGTGMVDGIVSGAAVISYTFGTGCAAAVVVTVNVSPAAVTGSPDLCVGLITNLSDATGAGTWASGNTSVATVDGTGTVTGTAPGIAVINYNLSDGCSTAYNVTVHAVPSAISGSAVFCTGSTITLSDAVTGGAWSSVNTAIATVGSTGIVSGVSLGTADIVYTLGAACTATATVTVSTGPAGITGTTTLCTGSVSALSDATISGDWSSTNTAVATVGSGTGNVLGVTAGTATISYALGVGCATTAVVDIITSSAAPVTGSAAVCVGQNTTLSDATPTGVWSSSNTAIATVSGTGMVSGVSAGLVTISYSVTNICGTAVATQVVMVNALPVVAAISGSPNVCVGSSVTLLDATLSGVWSSGNTALATVDPFGIVTGIAVGSVPVSYTVTNISGCVSGVFVIATVSLSAPPITGIASVCPGLTTALSDPAGGGVWTSGNTTIATVGATSGIVTGLLPGAPVITYVAAGCSATAIVTVNTLPALYSVTGGSSYCAGGTGVNVGITNSDAGVNYELYNGSTLIITLPGISTALNFGLQTLAGTYTVVAGNTTTGCTNNMAGSAVITITPLSTPSVSINAAPGDTICAGGHVTFTASPVFGGASPVYQWTKNGINITAGSSYTPVPIPADGDTIGCTMVSDYACLASLAPATTSLAIHVEPAALNLDTIKVTKSGIITGQTDTFVVVAPNAGASPSYQWYLNGLAIPGATNATYITAGLTNGDVVRCQVASSDVCSLPQTNFSNSIKVLVGTGVNNVSDGESNFTLLPNPNKGTFQVSGKLNDPADGTVSIMVTDMLGQTVYSKTAQADNGALNERITLGASVASGMYLVKIIYGDDCTVFHIVVTQ